MNKREHAFSHWLFYILAGIAAIVLVSCGGGGGDKLLPLQGVSNYQLIATIGTSTISPNGSTTVTVTLKDPAGVPVSGATVSVGVGGPATLNKSAIVTDSSGQGTVTLTGNGATSGSGTFTATYVDSSNSKATFSIMFSILNGNNIILTTSKTQLKTGVGDTAVITAFLTDSTGVALANTPVIFSLPGTNSGSLSNLSGTPAGTTDSNGRVTVTYTPDTVDRSNKTVSISASTVGTGSVTASLTLTLSGTTIQLTSPQSSVVLPANVNITATLIDGNKVAIPNTSITLTARETANLPAGGVTLTTDSNGQAVTNTTLTAATSGQAVFNALSQGASGTLAFSVSSTSFSISAPASGAVLAIGTPQTVTLHYTNNGVGVSGQTIFFSTTVGTLSAASAVTNASGDATVTVTSNSAGQAVLTANTAANALTASQTVTFSGTTPTQISVQASKTNLNVNEQTAIVANVRDANNNPVSGQIVQFNRVKDDSSGPGLSAATAVTDASGQASVTYTAGTIAGATNGVEINATVQGTSVTTQVPPATPSDALLTVGGTAAFIAIGSGNTMDELDSTTYSDPHNVIVTSTTGAPIPNQQVVLSVIPVNYYKGVYVIGSNNLWAPSGPGSNAGTFMTPTQRLACANEDVNQDGILNAGEDINGNGKLDPGNPVTLSSGVVTTDSNGHASFSIIFGKNYGNWLNVKITATTTVLGTESKTFLIYDLPILAKDADTSKSPPGGLTGAFGKAAVCTDPN